MFYNYLKKNFSSHFFVENLAINDYKKSERNKILKKIRKIVFKKK